jgi:hypothetical protein
MLMYPIVVFLPVKILVFTEGTVSFSLVTSFSITSFVQLFPVLSIRSFTLLHFGHLIRATASFRSKSLTDQVPTIIILSIGKSPALKAGESLSISSIIT